MEERRKHKVMIGIELALLCIIVAILGTNAESSDPPSSGVSYSKNSQTTVEGALNDLYTKANYGDATAAQILKGKKALVKGKQVTGTYEAPSLASQTPGNATAIDIAEGKIAWVNGEKIVGATKNLAEKLRLGDYINYTPSSTSYTIAKEETGYTSGQTINPSELTLWRVIRRNNDGTVEIVSVNGSTSSITFMGETGYKNFVGALNKLAKSYESSLYTVGSRHTGYDSTKATEYLTSVANSGNSDNGYETDKNLLKSSIGEIRAKNNTYDVYGYWIASRNYIHNGIHYLYAVDADGGTISIGIKTSSGYSSVRPIVILKSTLKLISGDGSLSTPYRLGV